MAEERVKHLLTKILTKIEPRGGEAIPTEEIKRMVDVLISLAESYPPDSEMHKTCLLRASYYMDLVMSWRHSQRQLKPGESDPRD